MVRTLISNQFMSVQNRPLLVLTFFYPHMTGVVISIISEKNGEGYALVLDGSTFEEIAAAKFPYGLPYGLHGCWVPKQ
jgi:carotenoid cleavage dioxygenase-like enzyme